MEYVNNTAVEEFLYNFSAIAGEVLLATIIVGLMAVCIYRFTEGLVAALTKRVVAKVRRRNEKAASMIEAANKRIRS